MAFLLWLAELCFWLGWIIIAFGGPFAWVIYGSLHHELHVLRRDFRATQPIDGNDAIEWFLGRQTPMTPRLRVDQAGTGTQDLGDTGHQDLGFTAHSRPFDPASYPPRIECNTCHFQYEPPWPHRCRYCEGRSFTFVVKTVSSVPGGG